AATNGWCRQLLLDSDGWVHRRGTFRGLGCRRRLPDRIDQHVHSSEYDSEQRTDEPSHWHGGDGGIKCYPIRRVSERWIRYGSVLKGDGNVVDNYRCGGLPGNAWPVAGSKGVPATAWSRRLRA